MFLSGGIDSSAIAAVMSEMVADPIKTFSVAFAEREANELEYARVVARAFGTDHHEIIVSPEQFFDSLPSLVYQEDEPIAHPSSVPLYFVSKLARDHVKVVLTGEGSDELLAGYAKYRKTVYNLAVGRAYHRSLPSSIRRAVAGAIKRLSGASRARQKLSRTFLCLRPEIEEIYFDNFSVFSRAMQRDLFSQQSRERMPDSDPYRAAIDHIGGSKADALLDQLLAADMKTYLHELLMKQDQMSMAASIESRVPFLDHKLVEFAAALPARMKLRGLKTKYILRRAMDGRLPKQILTRSKMGFPVPVGAWLRGPFAHVVDEYVLGERAAERGLFNREFVREVVARHRAGENHTERLWALINFEIWQRRFFDGEEAAEPELQSLSVTSRAGQSVALAGD
jgi:asparagine synthase (glutamine-hydrolysing)